MPLGPSLRMGAAGAAISDRSSESGSPGRISEWPLSNRPYAVREGLITTSILALGRYLR